MPDGQRWTPANLSVRLPSSYCYNDDPALCQRYGRLYTWQAAQDGCRSLGAEWRLPSREEWRTLARAYGGLSGDGASDGKEAFRELMAGGGSGLDMLLGGGREVGTKEYARLEAHGFYWTATEDSPATARYLNFAKGSLALYEQDGGEKGRALSVRCVAG